MKRGNCKTENTIRTSRGRKLTFTDEEWNSVVKGIEESGILQKGPSVNDGKWWNQVYAISLELPMGKDCRCINELATVNIKGVEESFFKLDRFRCWVYTEMFSSMFNSQNGCRKFHGRSRWVTIEVPCDKVWKSGEYTLLVYDDDDDSLIRILFSINKEVKPRIEVFRHSDHLGDGIYNMYHSYEEAQVFSGEGVVAESTDVGFELIVNHSAL